MSPTPLNSQERRIVKALVDEFGLKWPFAVHIARTAIAAGIAADLTSELEKQVEWRRQVLEAISTVFHSIWDDRKTRDATEALQKLRDLTK